MARSARRALSMAKRLKVAGHWRFYLDGELVAEKKNLVVTSGLAAIAKLLANEETNDCAVHLAWGTDDTAAAAGQVKLVAESGRRSIVTRYRSGADVDFRVFMLASEAVGTWYEWGLFLFSTAVADSGDMLCRLVEGAGITKTSAQLLTVEITISFAAA